MQTIIKTAPASNFTTIANDLINSTMPGNAQKVLLYLLSKPSNWQLKTHDLRKQLGLTAYAVKKALRWLLQAGFAAYTRVKSGHTIWRIFDKPQTQPQEKTVYRPVISPQVEIPQVAFQPDLTKKETETKKETTTASIPITKSPLPENGAVVSFEEKVIPDTVASEEKTELTFPLQLTQVQKKAAKHVIKKVKQPELRQPVLFVLAYAMAQNKVKSPVAYLNGLISRANAGTFEPVGAATAMKQGGKPLIPIWQGYGPSTPSNPEKAKTFIQQAKSVLRGAAL